MKCEQDTYLNLQLVKNRQWTIDTFKRKFEQHTTRMSAIHEDQNLILPIICETDLDYSHYSVRMRLLRRWKLCYFSRSALWVFYNEMNTNSGEICKSTYFLPQHNICKIATHIYSAIIMVMGKLNAIQTQMCILHSIAPTIQSNEDIW